MKIPIVILLAVSAAARLPAQPTNNGGAGSAPHVTYIANDGFLIEAAGKKILIDALFNSATTQYDAPSAETMQAMTRGEGPFTNLDLILVTHSHADHFDPDRVIACLQKHPRCQMLAQAETVDRLKKANGFDEIEQQVHAVNAEIGAVAHTNVGGIAVDAMCLEHVHDENAQPSKTLAFTLTLGSARWMHCGDASLRQNLAWLNRLDDVSADYLFANFFNRSPEVQEFIAKKIKPAHIVAMHIPTAEKAEQRDKFQKAYPHAIFFRQSMERRSLPIEADFHNLTGDYFGQKPPGATPQLFARGIVSTLENEHSAPSFSPDGNEVFWWANWWPDEGPSFGMTMRRENGKWSAPQAIPFGYMPVFSPDGRRIYYYARRPGGAAPDEQPLDIWFAEKRDGSWGEPQCLNFVERFPEQKSGVFTPTVTRDGTLYFTGHGGVYRAELINGEYAKPEFLPRSINMPGFGASWPIIAPDESYLLFSSNRAGGRDEYGDIYISRRQPDGSWTDPENLGEPVNTRTHEAFPGVSPDGKYLFFTRWMRGRKHDVYWVEAASVPALRPSATSSEEKAK
jgi:L-ascorbate metabolism protein UlaG (beta-lactamase superfamily)